MDIHSIMDINVDLVYKVFDKKPRDNTTDTGAGIISEDQQLANELHKFITRKFQRRKVYSSY